MEHHTWDYNDGSTIIYGNLISSSVCLIVDHGETLEQQALEQKLKNTVTHEMGHALGWIGHSSNSNDVMYSVRSSISVLTSRDITHLEQVY